MLKFYKILEKQIFYWLYKFNRPESIKDNLMSDSFYEVISSYIRLSDMPGGIIEWIFSFFSEELGKSIS